MNQAQDQEFSGSGRRARRWSRGRLRAQKESAGKIAQLSAGTAARPTNQVLAEIGLLEENRQPRRAGQGLRKKDHGLVSDQLRDLQS